MGIRLVFKSGAVLVRFRALSQTWESIQWHPIKGLFITPQRMTVFANHTSQIHSPRSIGYRSRFWLNYGIFSVKHSVCEQASQRYWRQFQCFRPTRKSAYKLLLTWKQMLGKKQNSRESVEICDICSFLQMCSLLIEKEIVSRGDTGRSLNNIYFDCSAKEL